MSFPPLALGLSIALFDAAPESARDQARVHRPEAVVTIPNPRDVLPRLRALLDLAGPRARGKAAERWIKVPAELGFDPFDSAALEANGIDVGQPAYVWSTGIKEVQVIELAVAKPELVDRAVARTLARRKGARSAADKGKGIASGITVGAPDNPSGVVVRKASRLFVQTGQAGPRSGASGGFPAIAGAETGAKPKRAPRAGERGGGEARAGAQVWFHGEGRAGAGVDRVEAIAWLDRGHIQVTGDIFLEMAAGLILGDLASSNGRAHPLLSESAELEAVFEVLASAGPSAVAAGLDAMKLPPELAGVLTGEIHTMLTAGGSIVFAAALRATASDARASEIVHAVSTWHPDMKATVRKNGSENTLIAWMPGEDGKSVEDIVTRSTPPNGSTPARREVALRPKPEGGAPISVLINPSRMFEALDHRARAKSGPPLDQAEITRARDASGDLLKRAKGARLDIAFPPGVVEGTLTIDYDEAPVSR